MFQDVPLESLRVCQMCLRGLKLTKVEGAIINNIVLRPTMPCCNYEGSGYDCAAANVKPELLKRYLVGSLLDSNFLSTDDFSFFVQGRYLQAIAQTQKW